MFYLDRTSNIVNIILIAILEEIIIAGSILSSLEPKHCNQSSKSCFGYHTLLETLKPST